KAGLRCVSLMLECRIGKADLGAAGALGVWGVNNCAALQRATPTSIRHRFSTCLPLFEERGASMERGYVAAGDDLWWDDADGRSETTFLLSVRVGKTTLWARNGNSRPDGTKEQTHCPVIVLTVLRWNPCFLTAVPSSAFPSS